MCYYGRTPVQNIVTGDWEHVGIHCQEMRSYVEYCGPSGKYFAPKLWYQRVHFWWFVVVFFLAVMWLMSMR